MHFREVRLNVEAVSAEVKLLKSVAGTDDLRSLESIDWENCMRSCAI